MKKAIEDIIREFIDDELFLHNYTKIENMRNRDYDAKLTVKIGKRIEKNLRVILRSDDYTTQFMQLLIHEDAHIRFVAARYLYPILPQKAITIMTAYMNGLSDEFSKHEIENVIRDLQNKLPVFMEQFKKLYGVDDLEALNREKR